MPDTKSFCDGVGYLAVGLHGDHGVAGIERRVVQVRHELIERFRAYTAGKAVFEEKERPLIGSRKGPVEVVNA